NDDETDDAFSEKARDARILPITKQTQRGYGEDRPKRPCQNGNENAEHQPNPGAIAIPEFLSLFGSAFCPARCDENQNWCQNEQNNIGQRYNNRHRLIKCVAESE